MAIAVRRRRPSRLAWFLVLVTALAGAGCDLSDMAFRQDHRVRILAPDDRSQVELPLVVEWEVDGFEVTGPTTNRRVDAGYFGIFVDRPPMPPGRDLEWLAAQEDSCGNTACGTVDALAHIYTATTTSLEITGLPADARPGTVERHELAIVLLDGTGARIGESAFYVQFTYDRDR